MSCGTITSIYGNVPGNPPGTTYANRLEVSRALVHRPLQAGICGTSDRGAEPIVVSGGYVDDVDTGDEIIYTGAGGQAKAKGVSPKELRLARDKLGVVK